MTTAFATATTDAPMHFSGGSIRPLTDAEIANVNGGILPLIGFGLSLASHVGVGGVAATATGHVMSSVGLGLATFGAAVYARKRWGGGRRRGRKHVKSN